jgi:hypothetical protein
VRNAALDVSILMVTVGRYRGVPTRSKVSMMSMRRPQQGHGCERLDGSLASVLVAFSGFAPTACAQRMSGEPASFSVRRRRRDRAALTRSLDPTLAEPYSVPPHDATLAAPHPANSKCERSCRGRGASCPSFAYPGAGWRPSSRRRRTPRRALLIANIDLDFEFAVLSHSEQTATGSCPCRN